MKNLWKSIKEHPIYSKVAAGLILAGLLAIFNRIFSWNIFSSMFSFASQKYIIPVWGLVAAGLIVGALFLSIILFLRKRKGSLGIAADQRTCPERVRVIRSYDKPHQYLVVNNIARHIPDPETFIYLGQFYGFSWENSEVISPEDLEKQFTSQDPLPSICPHFEAIHERKKREEPLWESPYYWKLEDGKKDGPYCQCCYDSDKKLIRLQESVKGYWKCKVCDNDYKDGNYQPHTLPGRRVINRGTER